MLTLAPLAMVGGLALCHAAAADADLRKMQGNWDVIGMQADGKRIDPKDFGEHRRFKFVGRELRIGDDPLGPGGAFTLSVGQKYRRFTQTADGPDGPLVFHGLYSFTGDDILRLCLNQNGESPQKPTDFAAGRGSPFVVITLTRAK